MNRPFSFMIVAALAVVACAETPEDSADAVIDGDTTSIAATDGAPSSNDARDAAGATDPAAEPDETMDDDAGATIPARFHGEWNADRSACGSGSSETRLRIDADRIRFYESVGVVSAVQVVGERVIVVTAEYTGEGDTWQDERRLSLSADGGSLTVSGGGDLVRYRCP